MFLLFVLSIALLVLALTYLWSVVNDHRLRWVYERKVRMNDEMWLTFLLSDECYRTMDIIADHPDDLGEWVRTSAEGKESTDVMFHTYINLLNTCSMLEMKGVLSKSLFWDTLGGCLQNILACKDMYGYVSRGNAWYELKEKLAEAAKRESV